MTVETQPRVQILEDAWNRYAQLDALSKRHSRLHYFWRRLIFILSVIAVLLAIINQAYMDAFSAGMNMTLKVLLIALLIAVSTLAAFLDKFDDGSDWRVYRTGADGIQKEIYLYRTVFKDLPDRQERLEMRLTDIQKQLHRAMGGKLVLGNPPTKISPNYDSSDLNSDEGFNDLTGEEYARYRLENQLAEHIRNLQRYEGERSRLQIYILAIGVVGVLLAAFGGSYSIWVAVNSSIVAILIGWQGLRNLDPVVMNCSRIVTELMTIYDQWNTLEPENRTKSDFFRLVKSTENVLWNQNVDYIRPVLDEFAGVPLDETELKDNGLIMIPVEADKISKDEKRDNEVDIPSQALEDVHESSKGQEDEVTVSLVKEASSDLVQAELAAMAVATGQAGSFAVLADGAGTDRLSDTLDSLAKQFEGKEIGRNTPASVLNDLLSRFPTTNDVKG